MFLESEDAVAPRSMIGINAALEFASPRAILRAKIGGLECFIAAGAEKVNERMSDIFVDVADMKFRRVV